MPLNIGVFGLPIVGIDGSMYRKPGIISNMTDVTPKSIHKLNLYLYSLLRSSPAMLKTLSFC